MSTVEEVAANLGLASTSSLNAASAVASKTSDPGPELTDLDALEPKRGRGRPKKIKIEKQSPEREIYPGTPQEKQSLKEGIKLDDSSCSDGTDAANVGLSRRSIRLKAKPQRKYTHYGIELDDEEVAVKNEESDDGDLPLADAVKMTKYIPARKRKSKVKPDPGPPVHDANVVQCKCDDCKQQKGLPLKKRKCEIKLESKVDGLEASQVESVESLMTKDGKPALSDDVFTPGAKIFMITVRHKKKGSNEAETDVKGEAEKEGNKETPEAKASSPALKKKRKKKKVPTATLR